MWLYELFLDFVGTAPRSTNRLPDKRTGKTYNSLQFKTLRFPCFNYFHDQFYINGGKIVPSIIYDLLTPIGLAF